MQLFFGPVADCQPRRLNIKNGHRFSWLPALRIEGLFEGGLISMEARAFRMTKFALREADSAICRRAYPVAASADPKGIPQAIAPVTCRSTTSDRL